MGISMWSQLSEVKSRVLELVNVLIEEDDEDFTREHAILDLMDISKDLHYLEEKAMLQMEKVDRKRMIEITDYKDSLRGTKNAPATGIARALEQSVM